MMANALEKTKHFEHRWIERVGGDPPTVKEVEAIIANSVVLQKAKDLYTLKGQPCRIMAVYWDPDRQLVFKVDRVRRKVVTVLTPSLRKEEK